MCIQLPDPMDWIYPEQQVLQSVDVKSLCLSKVANQQIRKDLLLTQRYFSLI